MIVTFSRYCPIFTVVKRRERCSRSMGPASRLDGDHREVSLQRRLRHPVPRPEAGLCRRGAGQQQGQLHRALQAAKRGEFSAPTSFEMKSSAPNSLGKLVACPSSCLPFACKITTHHCNFCSMYSSYRMQGYLSYSLPPPKKQSSPSE